MKVFISWSGEASKAVATALHEWLPRVIQYAEPWVSTQDISSGGRWSLSLGEQLQEQNTGILCLTPDNLTAPWILFEAGALSKWLGNSLVCPYLFRVESTEVTGPLGQFHMEKADKEGTRKLLATINNAAIDRKLESVHLQESFDMWWPRLEEKLASIELLPSAVPRPDRDLLVEILNIVRQLSRDMPRQLPSFVQSAVARAKGSSAAAARLITQKELEEALESVEKNYRTAAERLIRQAESPAEAAAREERLKSLDQQLLSKKDKKDEED